MIFLKRVSYKDGRLCDEMLHFDYTSLEPTEDIEDHPDSETSVETNTSNVDDKAQEKIDAMLCQSCFVRNRDCFMEPCHHVYFCMQCYDRWSNVNPETFDIQYEDATAEDLLNLEPLQKTKCPICREAITSGKQFIMT